MTSHYDGIIAAKDGRERQEAAPEDTRPRYVIHNAAFALQPRDPLQWVLDHVFTIPSLNMVFGEPGSKKTYAMISYAVCVAIGKKWLGKDVMQLTVLIVDEESGEDRLSRRIAEAIRGEFGDENLPLHYVSLAGFHFDNQDDVNELQLAIMGTEARLVIIDALADVMLGDENSKQDVQPIFNNLRRVSEVTGACIIIIHHSNKAGGYRGSSAIKGSIDQMIEIKSPEDDPIIEFKSQKARDSKHSKFAAVAHWADGTFWLTEADPLEKLRGNFNKSQLYVMRYLEEHGASPLPDIMGAADTCSPNAARQAVYALTELGLVYRTNPEEKGRGVVAIYELVDKEDETS